MVDIDGDGDGDDVLESLNRELYLEVHRELNRIGV